MAFDKLTKADLARYRTGGGGGHPEYVPFLQNLKPGEGGWTTTEQEKVGRQTIKNRLTKSAEHLGIKIKFKRSESNKVVFEVVE